MKQSSSLALFVVSLFFAAAGPACTEADSGGSGGGGGCGGATDSEDGTTTDSGGGTTTGNPFFADPPEGTFPCGDGECAAATEVCVLQVDGMCCGQKYGCAPLPTSCEDLEPDCGCVEELGCPCGAGCGPGVLVTCQRDAETGVFNVYCGNP